MKPLLILALLSLQTPHPIQLIGTNALGHACPAGEKIYTAAHVMEDVDAIAWNEGEAVRVWKSLSRDLAVLEVDKKVSYYPLAKTIQTDEEVHWYEYSFNKKNLLKPVRRKAKVLRQVSGHIVFDKLPSSGASGTCLLNADNEAIGVVIWSMSKSGIAASLIGDWANE